jgi:hypothetical protein
MRKKKPRIYHLKNITLFREEAGIISKEPFWGIIHEGYLYMEDTLIHLIWTFITEYQKDKHLVG